MQKIGERNELSFKERMTETKRDRGCGSVTHSEVSSALRMKEQCSFQRVSTSVKL